ncbi:MAG: aspartate kinase [Gemmataceae bacterium]
MGIVVQKFGGSSVATAARIVEAARKAIRAKQAGHQVIVVVSARGDTTDDLIDMAKEISEKPPAREMDMLLATGEQISIALTAMAVHELGDKAISFTGPQIGIVTDSMHTKARIKSINTKKIREALDAGHVVIVAGFQGMDESFDITTLGRGGSDTTAVALAAAMKTDDVNKTRQEPVQCEIYTDVDGVYTTDPRLVPDARKMDAISYDEMLEMASMGAGVMHSRSIEFAKKFDVPLMVRNSFSDAIGTWIVPEADWMREIPVCGAALARDEARVVLDGVPDQPGVSHKIFSAVAAASIAVDMVAQSAGTGGRASIGFTVLRTDLRQVLNVLAPIAQELGASIQGAEDVSKVSIVGAGMRSVTGVAERMFAALASEKINVKMITTGDIKISVLVDKSEGVRALKAVHAAFGLHQPRQGAGLGIETDPTKEFPARPTPMIEDEAREVTSAASRLAGMEDILVSGVHRNTDQSHITIFDLPDQPGHCSTVFNAVASGGIIVDMIVQNLTVPGRAELSFTVPKADLTRALKRTQDVVRGIDSTAKIVGDGDVDVLYVLGVGMRTHTGVARTMFGALASQGINISMINSSEVCIGVVIEKTAGERALACLRQAFLLQ